MSAASSRPPGVRPRLVGRATWPVALLAPIAVSRSLPSFSFGTFTAAETVAQIAVVGLAIVACGYAVGGRTGLITVVVLSGVATYCAWWLSIGIDRNSSTYTWPRAAEGLQRWSGYVAAIATNLWPILLAAAIVTVVAGRRIAVPAWHALGVLALTLLVLATPYRAGWNDGCNDHFGAASAVAIPAVSTLMDAGIGVLPDSSTTQMECFRRATDGTAHPLHDGSWKPFWKGDDGLASRWGALRSRAH